MDMITEFHFSPEELETIVPEIYKNSRIEHVRGCVHTVKELCRRYSPESAEDMIRAAYLHDITKKYSLPFQLILCRKYGILLTDDETSSPAVIHAITGASVAKSIFDENETVVRSIRWHTTGRPQMTKEEIIMFLSDMIEPTRDYPELNEIRSAVDSSLYYGLEIALKRSLEFIESKGQVIHPATREAYRWICDYNSQNGVVL